jgi:hypothetical protein
MSNQDRDPRSLDQRIADWETELAEAKLQASHIKLTSDEVYLENFIYPDRQMITYDERIDVSDMAEALTIMRRLGVAEGDYSKWQISCDRYGENTFLQHRSERPETDEEYNNRILKEKQRFLESAKCADIANQGRKKNLKALNRKITGLQERLSRCKPKAIKVCEVNKVNIYSWYGKPEVVAPYEHNSVIEANPLSLVSEFCAKGYGVQLRPATVEDAPGFLLMVSDAGFGQK